MAADYISPSIHWHGSSDHQMVLLHQMVALFVTAWLALQADPFAFLGPAVVLTADDRRRLERGAPVARVLPAAEREIAVVAIVPVTADADRVSRWIRRIEALKRSDLVPAIGRFSDPPTIDDLATLTLDADDLSALRVCRADSCGLKLAPAEIAAITRAIASAGREWPTAAQTAFRDVILARARNYLAAGESAAANDDVWPSAAVARLVQHSVFLTAHMPALAADIVRPPQARREPYEAFLYWSKERLSGKAVISISDVTLVRGVGNGQPVVLSAGRQIFASHYLDASLGVTALVRGGAHDRHYLVYVNRSEVDVLAGMFGGMVRWVAERRVRNEAGRVLDALRHRIESGEPPG